MQEIEYLKRSRIESTIYDSDQDKDYYPTSDSNSSSSDNGSHDANKNIKKRKLTVLKEINTSESSNIQAIEPDQKVRVFFCLGIQIHFQKHITLSD